MNGFLKKWLTWNSVLCCKSVLKQLLFWQLNVQTKELRKGWQGFKCGNSKTDIYSETPSKYLLHGIIKLSQQTGDQNPQLQPLSVVLHR